MSALTKEQMAEVRDYRVYRHTLPNGAIYIGITQADTDYRRTQNGNGYYKQPFHEAIMAEGWKTVKTNILEEVHGTWYEAHEREVAQIKLHYELGYELLNRSNMPKKPKEYTYKVEGVTILDINRYFPKMKDAADYLGVTTAAVSIALKEDRPCKKYSLAYGDVTYDKE